MRRLIRRDFILLGLCTSLMPILPRSAAAQSYPGRPLRLVVGLAPGGATDIIARLIGEWLSARIGQSVVIENRPGAAGSVAAEMVLRSPADGYTLFMAASANVINTQNDKVSIVRESAPIAMIGQEPIILSINPSLPVKTLQEFIAYAKANPGKLSMASPGNGTVPHIAGELFQAYGRRRYGPRTLSRRRAGAYRSHGRAGAGCIHGTGRINVVHKGRKDSRTRGDFQNACGCIPGHPGRS
jgi:tripartite-type tricarboxylate transporter receptor subunit TctC